jgi:metal-responsive CopG/Arc/MetJ family transcriptional regulator
MSVLKILMPTKVIGISFNEELIKKIDRDRGDVSRSRFVQRLIEEAYKAREILEKRKVGEGSVK